MNTESNPHFIVTKNSTSECPLDGEIDSLYRLQAKFKEESSDIARVLSDAFERAKAQAGLSQHH